MTRARLDEELRLRLDLEVAQQHRMKEIQKRWLGQICRGGRVCFGGVRGIRFHTMCVRAWQRVSPPHTVALTDTAELAVVILVVIGAYSSSSTFTLSCSRRFLSPSPPPL